MIIRYGLMFNFCSRSIEITWHEWPLPLVLVFLHDWLIFGFLQYVNRDHSVSLVIVIRGHIGHKVLEPTLLRWEDFGVHISLKYSFIIVPKYGFHVHLHSFYYRFSILFLWDVRWRAVGGGIMTVSWQLWTSRFGSSVDSWLSSCLCFKCQRVRHQFHMK